MKVDFYVLKTNSGLKAWHFVCQLIEQFYQDKKSIYVHTRTHNDATRMDHLLWTFKDISFIPHELYQTKDKTSPIAIGCGETVPLPSQTFDILVNLSMEAPSFYTQFPHLIEIVFSDPNMQQLARERFRYYREQGLTLNTIKTNH